MWLKKSCCLKAVFKKRTSDPVTLMTAIIIITITVTVHMDTHGKHNSNNNNVGKYFPSPAPLPPHVLTGIGVSQVSVFVLDCPINSLTVHRPANEKKLLREPTSTTGCIKTRCPYTLQRNSLGKGEWEGTTTRCNQTGLSPSYRVTALFTAIPVFSYNGFSRFSEALWFCGCLGPSHSIIFSPALHRYPPKWWTVREVGLKQKQGTWRRGEGRGRVGQGGEAGRRGGCNNLKRDLFTPQFGFEPHNERFVCVFSVCVGAISNHTTAQMTASWHTKCTPSCLVTTFLSETFPNNTQKMHLAYLFWNIKITAYHNKYHNLTHHGEKKKRLTY